MDNNPYKYHQDQKSLEEIKKIYDEIEECYKKELWFSTIILCGALSERLLSEKLLGHSVIDKKINGIVFFRDVEKERIVCGENNKKQFFIKKIKKKEIELCENTVEGLKKREESLCYTSSGKHHELIGALFNIENYNTIKNKLKLAKLINMGQTEIDKINKIHEQRIKYFHPLQGINLKQLKQEGEEIMESCKELIRNFYYNTGIVPLQD